MRRTPGRWRHAVSNRYKSYAWHREQAVGSGLVRTGSRYAQRGNSTAKTKLIDRQTIGAFRIAQPQTLKEMVILVGQAVFHREMQFMEQL